MDIVFVILHYKTHKDTIACVSSVRNRIDTVNYKIVIVDNGSQNGSYEILSKEFGTSDDVIIIHNETNLGFSKGLNVGIEYANEKWSPSFVAAINNDTQIISSHFWKILYKKYDKYHFALLGPMIVSKDGYCCTNPIRNTPRDKKDVYKSIKRYKKIIKIIKARIYTLYCLLQRIKYRSRKPIRKLPVIEDCVDYKLHGSFLVFSQEYFSKFSGFDGRTFLYGEEDLLYLHILKNGLHTLYTPEILIYHKEDSATSEAIPDNEKKMAFVCRNCIDSLNIYLETIDYYEKESVNIT